VKTKRLTILLLAWALVIAGCIPPTSLGGSALITILYTNDEHGWLAPAERTKTTLAGGAAEMMGAWGRNERYPNASTIALSGGDMWTGPAISTWFKGESSAEVMNAMGYRAAAVGNHDFDFGRNVLLQRQAASPFPFLSANITTQDGRPVDFAIPYTLLDVSGIRLGIVGLTARETPQITKREYVSDLAFGDYQAAVRKHVAEARRQGADVIMVLGHVCLAELATLAGQVQDLDIPVMFGAHCHEADSRQVGDTWLVESGSFLRAYSRVDMQVEPGSGRVTQVKVKLVKNEWDKAAGPPAPPDPNVQAIVARWQARADAELDQVIGYTHKGIARPWPMYNMVTDAWLWAYPQADIAISNGGGFRQDINAGEITLAEIVGVMPFENTLYDVKLTGAQVVKDLTCCGGVAASGVKMENGAAILVKTGRPVDPQATYRVLVNDFMYTGGDSFPLQKQDPNGYNTAISWRQPVIDWIMEQNSSASAPLDGKIDAEPRGTSGR
jgi:5'-nucleotidase/UDP-sugar diphosphatase